MDYPLNTTEQLRQHLRSLRKKRGLTQARLGAQIGVTQARVVEIEANPGSVSLQQIMQVLNVLGAAFVIRDTDAKTADAASEAPRVSDVPPRMPADATPAKVKKGSW